MTMGIPLSAILMYLTELGEAAAPTALVVNWRMGPDSLSTMVILAPLPENYAYVAV